MPLTLFQRVEPSLGAQEAAYRLHFFSTDKAQARASTALVLVRAVFVVFSFIVFWLARGINTPAGLDRATLVWTVGFATQFVVMSIARTSC